LLYSVVLFDHDGTLLESGPGILAVARTVLREMNLPDQPDETMVKMIGPPLVNCYSDILNVPSGRLSEAVDRHRKLAQTIGMEGIRPYPGIPELLASLKQVGAFVGVVTSRNTEAAVAHLERFGLMPDIDYVRGGEPGGSAEKLALLHEALADLHADSRQTVMVGDRHFDLLAARDTGIDSVGVTYGYGSAEEIAACNPTYTVSSAAELGKLLLNGTSMRKE
jgi:phosphoglycolate phosphatase